MSVVSVVGQRRQEDQRGLDVRNHPPQDRDAATRQPATLFFTDIEASVRRWETDPEAMAVDLARHVAILTSVVESHGGDIVKWTGDGALATFLETNAAFAAAIEAQDDLRSAAWVAAQPLLVRIAIHVGHPQRAWGDLHGPCVNRCARVVQATAGGHVVVSGAARDAAANLPHGARLRDLDEHALPDVREPLHLFELVGPGAEIRSPALRHGHAA